jgi:hypothetical protein
MDFFSCEPLLPGEATYFFTYEKRAVDGLCIHNVAISILNRRLWFSWTTDSPPDPTSN